MTTYTPRKISREILRLCQKIAPEQIPIYLAIKSEPESKQLDCFENVKRKIQKNGGAFQYGWQIWEWPDVMIEAEFHAVWKSPQDAWIDITPKQINTSKILFLPDSNKTYEGKQVNNFRQPLRADPLIREYIEICNGIFEELNRGDLAYYYGPVVMPKNLLKRKLEIEFELNSRRKVGRNDICVCGSGRKYKLCCGRILLE